MFLPGKGKIPIDTPPSSAFLPPLSFNSKSQTTMKVSPSLKSLKQRHPNCQVVRRKGRVYVINKTHPRFKARQG